MHYPCDHTPAARRDDEPVHRAAYAASPREQQDWDEYTADSHVLPEALHVRIRKNAPRSEYIEFARRSKNCVQEPKVIILDPDRSPARVRETYNGTGNPVIEMNPADLPLDHDYNLVVKLRPHNQPVTKSL